MKCLFISLLFISSAVSAWAAPSAFVTIAPQKYFVDKISGGIVPVSVMIQPGANPHAYEPRPKQMAELAKASLYFTIGDTFDAVWLKRFAGTNPALTIVHTEKGVDKIPSEDPDDAISGQQDGHGGEILDPHIWLDPRLVKIQAHNIRDGLVAADPEHASLYTANTEAFEKEIDELDATLRQTFTALPADRKTFLVFHPSWGYFAKAYGLSQASIEIDGKEPSPKEMARIIQTGKARGIRVIFVQPQFSDKSASVIAKQIGANVARLDPLAENWAENLRQAATAIANALK